MPSYELTYPYGVHDPTRGTFAVGDVIESAENPNPNFWTEVTSSAKSKKATPTTDPDKEQ
jgi:hypothetical protein